jgi:alpha-glucosidase/alpha-D-xyloside xylohydrolase
MTILPWGWGQGDRGDLETSTKSAPDSILAKRNVLLSSMNDPRIEPVVRKYDDLRYQLLPYTYTLAWEARATGMPLMRALWLHYPDDPVARGTGNEYLWGRDLLIAPVYEKGAASRHVYLPAGLWYDWWTSQAVPRPASGASGPSGVTIGRPVDLSIMPIYVRAGAIIPFDPVRQYTAQPVTTPTTLRIYPGANGDFTLYDDDGISQQYLHGKATWIRLRWNDRTHTLTLEPGAPAGFTSQPIHRRFILRLMTRPASSDKTITYDGKKIAARL